MANTVRIKRRAAGGAAGAPSGLANAELAFNEQDLTLYYGLGTGGVGGSATSVIPIGGNGSFVDKSSAQTIAGVKTFSSTIVGSIDGNSGTATKFATARTIGITGDATWTSPSFDGSANVTAALTLATVNSNVGTFTKFTVNAKGLITAASQASLSDLAVPTADFSFNSKKLTNLADPVNIQDAATKNYVDSVAQGLDIKASVVCATTANITLSGTQTIDGVTVAAGDRVLVKNQTAPAQNGIYVVSASAWSRSSDMDTWAEIPGAFTFVEQGTTNGDTGWACTSNAGGTIGTTSVTWAQFSGAGTYLAGNGLNLSGSTFAAVMDGSTLTVSASGIRISASYPGQNTIVTLGTVTTGTWNATTIGVPYGGTGVTTLTGMVKGNGTGAFSAAVDMTDYLSPNATIDGGTF